MWIKLNEGLKRKIYGNIIVLIGFPGSGKTTLGNKLKIIFKENKIETIHLDGDEIRKVLTEFKTDKSSRKRLTFIYLRLALLLSNKKNVIILSTVSLNKSLDKIKKKNINTFLIESNFKLIDKKKKKIRNNFLIKKNIYFPKKIDAIIRNKYLKKSCSEIINYFNY